MLWTVALRKESVDRNPIAAFLLMWWQRSLSARRAWIEINPATMRSVIGMSLSARRAWIEIQMTICDFYRAWSLSARRAWIEMQVVKLTFALQEVSLSARRAWIEMI